MSKEKPGQPKLDRRQSATHAATGQEFVDSEAQGLGRDAIDATSALDLLGLDLELEPLL